jgi:hypothetical protein
LGSTPRGPAIFDARFDIEVDAFAGLVLAVIAVPRHCRAGDWRSPRCVMSTSPPDAGCPRCATIGPAQSGVLVGALIPATPPATAGFACAAVLALAGMRTDSWRNARRALC